MGKSLAVPQGPKRTDVRELVKFVKKSKDGSFLVVLLIKMRRMCDTDEEKVWVTQSRNGDHAAFTALIRTHQQMIHSLTYRMTGSLADCKDLAQVTFIRAYQQLDSYQ